MKKRKLQQFANPDLKINKNNGMLYITQIKYIVRTAVKNIAGRRVLILYFYRKDEVTNGNYKPIYTLFQVKDDYITLEQSKGEKSRWLRACIDNFGDGCFVSECSFYTLNDEQRVTRFCDMADSAGFDALMRKQNLIMTVRKNKRIKERERKVIKKMKVISSLPRDWKGWLHREVLPAYLFYEYSRKKIIFGYCTACQHDVLISGAKHDRLGKCPHCKRKVTFKATGKSKKVFNRNTFQFIQKGKDNELILRIFKASIFYRDYRKPDLNIRESARIFIRQINKSRCVISYYYNDYYNGILTDWKQGRRPNRMWYADNFEIDLCGNLYCKNLENVLQGTSWRYCQIKQFYLTDCIPMDAVTYLYKFLEYPFIEYLIKLGLYKMTIDVVYKWVDKQILNTKENNIKKILQVTYEDIRHLQSIDADLNQLSRLQKFRKHEGRFEKELYFWCLENNVDYKDVQKPLKYMTGYKLIKYINKQYAQEKEERAGDTVCRYDKIAYVLQEFNDYLKTGKTLSYDFSDSFVLFPRGLKEAHDVADKILNMRIKQKYQREERQRKRKANDKISLVYNELQKKVDFAKDGLTIMLPKTAEEIVKEGHALHHCVGSYYVSHANGECFILFIRKKDRIDKPFYTMEIRNGAIKQVRGNKNTSPTPEVEKFVSLWESKRITVFNNQKAA